MNENANTAKSGQIGRLKSTFLLSDGLFICLTVRPFMPYPPVRQNRRDATQSGLADRRQAARGKKAV